jgi:hypothetical protein
MVERPIVTVPRSLMRVTAVDWDIDWREKGAREATDGSMQTVIAAAPRWVGTVPLRLTPETILAWRAIRDEARGRTGLYRLPLVDPLGINLAAGHIPAALRNLGVPFSTDERFLTGQGFSYLPAVELVAAAAPGDRVLILRDLGFGHPLRVGMFLSHNDWPIRITSRTEIEDDDGPLVEVTVAPFLRNAIPAGALIEMAATGIFEVTDGSGNPAYDLSRISTPTLNVQEWLNR